MSVAAVIALFVVSAAAAGYGVARHSTPITVLGAVGLAIAALVTFT